MARLVGTFSFLVLGLLVVLLVSSSFLISADLPRETVVEKYRNDASFFFTLPSGATAHIRDEGNRDGPALFLLHGSNASLHSWEPWVAQLGDTYRLISFDLPGHGLTGPVPGDDYSVTAMAQFTREIADIMKLDRIVLAGNSMGGAVALQFALSHPDRTKALVLISSGGMARKADDEAVGAFRLTSSTLLLSLMRYITPRFMIEDTLRGVVADPDNFVTDAMVDRYWELLRMTGNRQASIIRFSNPPSGTKIESLLGEITAPTLILWGAEDQLIKLEYGVRMHAAIFNSQLVGYANVGHLAMEEIPEKTAADTRAFLQDVIDP